jgi:hypothetical protein
MSFSPSGSPAYRRDVRLRHIEPTWPRAEPRHRRALMSQMDINTFGLVGRAGKGHIVSAAGGTKDG